MAMTPAELHVPRSLAKRMRKQPFELSFDRGFEAVIRACASVPRPDQQGTWITEEMIGAYVRLHELGFAHSAEAWRDGELVGGLYGVSLGSAFFGESMFARASDASKIVFVDLVEHLRAWDFTLVDCQVYTEHLERFGAYELSRDSFLQALHGALSGETRRGKWNRD
jgi:leucyl/phenylalanyl-tRNA--protein transferase